jgi:Mn-containing catalase
LREYYYPVKGKVLMEFNLKEKRARGQVTYIFKLKPEEEVKETLNKLREEDLYNKLQIDLRFNAK